MEVGKLGAQGAGGIFHPQKTSSVDYHSRRSVLTSLPKTGCAKYISEGIESIYSYAHPGPAQPCPSCSLTEQINLSSSELEISAVQF